MINQNNTVSLPKLRLCLGLLALGVSFYYSWGFVSNGTSGFAALSAMAFVLVTECAKALFAHDIAFNYRNGKRDGVVFASLVILILFALSIAATVFFLIVNPLTEGVKLENATAQASQLKTAIEAKQLQIESCNPSHVTKCINPRTAELDKLQADYQTALKGESSLANAKAAEKFWDMFANFFAMTPENLRLWFAIMRGVLLEVLGLVFIAQATAHIELKPMQRDDYSAEPTQRITQQQSNAVNNNALQTQRNAMIEDANCHQCNALFTPRTTWQTYCSSSCRNTANANRRRNHIEITET